MNEYVHGSALYARGLRMSLCVCVCVFSLTQSRHTQFPCRSISMVSTRSVSLGFGWQRSSTLLHR